MPMAYGMYQPPQGGMGRIVIDAGHMPSAAFLALTGPAIAINGRTQPIQWGVTPIDLPPGHYHLRMYTRYFGKFGPAELPVVLQPGQAVPVYYKAPAFMGASGNIGHTPQPVGGVQALVVVMVLMVLLPIIAMILILTG